MVAALALTAVTARSDVFWPAADRIAEGQRTGAGAAHVSRNTAVIERQRRRAAGDRHRLAHIERQRHDLASIEIASYHSRCRLPDATTDETVGAVVSICRLPPGWSQRRRDWRHCRRHR